MIIDNHTNYAWAIPLKDKAGKSTTTALKSPIEKAKRNPDKIWSDRDLVKTFLHYLKEQNTQFYSTNSGLKAVFLNDSIEHY